MKDFEKKVEKIIKELRSDFIKFGCSFDESSYELQTELKDVFNDNNLLDVIKLILNPSTTESIKLWLDGNPGFLHHTIGDAVYDYYDKTATSDADFEAKVENVVEKFPELEEYLEI